MMEWGTEDTQNTNTIEIYVTNKNETRDKL
uniref:Uncharacterized protein n=1 Tax=Nelumbo nucifera TaxID=4432 RepID=A0A822YFM0_NELNU|nr:TPA_asm: hypothetical protein HUJ06_031497 [Nelumbo nucifera]